MRIAYWILRLQTHFHNMQNSLLSTATKVAGTRLNVTLYVHWLSCYTCVLSAGTSCDEAFNDRQYTHGRNRIVHAVFTPIQITQASQYLALDKRRIVPEKEHF